MSKDSQKGVVNLLLLVAVGILAFLLISSALSSPFSFASGSVYYVSPSGSDSNSGNSPSSPWQTIQKVNSVTYSPGDRILFQGGQTFSGKIYMAPGDNGNAVSPIIISSYGTGRATISSGADGGFFSYDSQGFNISNINFAGAGASVNTSDGVSFYNDLANNVKLDHIYIDNADVSGYGKSGISIGGWNNDSGYSNVKITNTASHDNQVNGIITYGQNRLSNKNVYVGYSKSYNNTGTSTTGNIGGNGILLGSVDGGTIERSIAYNNGGQCNPNQNPVAIWTYDSNNVVIQYNEAYSQHSCHNDGGGFDLDQNTTNSVMQYNYSHDNDGAGFTMAQPQTNNIYNNNTIRYNISQNDARRTSAPSVIGAWGIILNSNIYNNTIYNKPPSGGSAAALSVANWTITSNYVNGLHFRNNIVEVSGGMPLVSVTADELAGARDILFQGNDYYPMDGNFKINWGDSTYNSLLAWRWLAGQETVNGGDSGFSVNPGLSSPGSGGTITDPNQLNTLSGYRLLSTSPLVNKGLNLSSLFGINPGPFDYFGVAIPQGSKFDVGASEYGSAATPTPAPTLTPTPTSTPMPTPTSTATPTPTPTPVPTPSPSPSSNPFSGYPCWIQQILGYTCS